MVLGLQCFNLDPPIMNYTLRCGSIISEVSDLRRGCRFSPAGVSDFSGPTVRSQPAYSCLRRKRNNIESEKVL